MILPALVSPRRSRRVVTPANDFAMADWVSRRTAADVTYFQDFASAAAEDFFFANSGDEVALDFITRDLTDGPTGSCLSIITPRSSIYAGSNSAAFRHSLNSAWTLNTQHFGTTRIYIAWRQKIDANRLVIPTAGWKFVNIAQFSIDDGGLSGNSNTPCEIVGQDSFGRGFPQAYYQDGTGFAAFEQTIGADIYLQNAIDNGSGAPNDRYCLYVAGDGSAGCYEWPIGEWFSMQMGITFGTYGGSSGNVFDMWIAPRDATSWTHTHHFTEFTLGNPQSGYSGSNGAHWHFYETGRQSQTVTVDTTHKITQILVGTSFHALPAVGA